MPSYKGHIIGGLLTYCLVIAAAVVYKLFAIRSIPQLIEWLLCTLAGALFPDLDTKSMGQKWFYRGLACISILLIAYEKHQAFTVVSLCGLVPLLVNHRGLLHRWWFIVGVAALYVFTITRFVPSYYNAAFFNACFFIVGAASHLWLDGGIRLLSRVR